MLYFTFRYTDRLQLHTLNNSAIHVPASVTDLEVTIDITNINNIAQRAHYAHRMHTHMHTVHYAIKKCFVSLDRSTLLRAFTPYVRPWLEYASSVSFPQSVGLIKTIESV